MMQIIERRESNKLISEFMGAKYVEGWPSASINPMYRFDTKPSFHPDHWHTFDFQIDYMLYHSSWDWLMPVVDKISKLDMIYYFSIIPNSSTDIMLKTIIIDDAFTFYYRVEEPQSTLDCLYMTIVSFIKWYNENKEETK